MGCFYRMHVQRIQYSTELPPAFPSPMQTLLLRSSVGSNIPYHIYESNKILRGTAVYQTARC